MAISNVADLLCETARHSAATRAFGFTSGGGGVEDEFTYGELAQGALSIGCRLRSLAAAGDRALLIFPPGLGFIRAFFGCLVAGVVAVPLSPPRRRQSVAGLRGLVANCAPSVVLCSPNLRERLREWFADFPELLALPWVACGDDEQQQASVPWERPQIEADSIALLQYTSGTTSRPKGVMVSHANLLANLAAIQRAFGTSSESRGVFWLPFYHDMGLIGGVLGTVFSGASSVFMPPTAFVQHPMAWLRTISRTRATISGGPDFAYRLCVQKLNPATCGDLDLSSWELAFTGAETVRGDTLDRFAEAFAPYGFRRRAFFPCYGLAEATLMVSGGPRPADPTVLQLDPDALLRHRVEESDGVGHTSRRVVGCGESMTGQEVVIVDPDTRTPLPADGVGEIWVRGPCVARGYLARPEASQEIFGALLSDETTGPFLRTGDLGFTREGQLFVTGRRKDLIIIRGCNYYPDDIEDVVQGAHEAFRPGHCVAFSIDGADGEMLVLVQEIAPRHREIDTEGAFRRIQEVVAGGFDLEVHAILLAKAGTIPKTTSGKMRRAACRDSYLDGGLAAVARWVAEPMDEASPPVIAGAGPTVTAAEIEDWLIERIAGRLRVPRDRIQKTTPFLEFGIGSLAAVQIAADLGRWLGRTLSPTTVYNYPTVKALAAWLAEPPRAAEEIPPVPLAAEAAPDAGQLLHEIQNLTEEDLEAFIEQEMAKPQAEARNTVPGSS